MSSQFSFTEEIYFENNKWSCSVSDVLTHVWPLLTNSRQEKIKSVVSQRCFDIAVVMEGIYDRGNISAVMRTAEGLGFSNIKIIETQEKFKESNRVTQGADKWVEVEKFKSTTEAIKKIKAEGYQLVVTALTEKAKPIHEVDFSRPTALVLGNEKSGASEEVIQSADHCVIVPMPGFVQSFNISVAGALCLYHIREDRIRRRGQCEDLTEIQKNILQAKYALRTLDSAEDILKTKLLK